RQPNSWLNNISSRSCYWDYRRYLSRFSVIRFSTDKSFKEHEAYWQWRRSMVKTSVGCDPVLTFCVADSFYNYCLQANTVFKQKRNCCERMGCRYTGKSDLAENKMG